MNAQRFYKILIVLFPTIFLFHNLEEWLVLRSKYSAILGYLPDFITNYFADAPDRIVSIFSVAVVVATILPIIVALFLWGTISGSKIKVLLIAMFAMLFNVISHIVSSIALGMMSPGVYTGILLCFPFSFFALYYSKRYFELSAKTYLYTAILSIPICMLLIALCWLIGILLI